MNIYDKQVIKCIRCKKSIGEIDYDATIIFPRCGDCSDPKPHIDDYYYVLKQNFDFPKKQIISVLPS